MKHRLLETIEYVFNPRGHVAICYIYPFVLGGLVSSLTFGASLMARVLWLAVTLIGMVGLLILYHRKLGSKE